MGQKMTKEVIHNIQIDHGLVYANYGLETQKQIFPTRGGSSFKVERTIRDIEYDGMKGKTMGMRTVDDENATLTTKTLDLSLDNLARALPGCTIIKVDEVTTKISSKTGLIEDEHYLANITCFCKTLGGTYRKITIYNAMADNGLEISAVQKAEGELELAFAAHYNPEDLEEEIYDIENIDKIVEVV